ncbi:LPS export ABC transporter periplasmic protein LptC [Pacificimonas sp. WHA3]|uniref:LPS export ABC transporter periplasmic protein LptC n=1 Tax=Pacificimonas pallii TaxID=2827236 RepID=A0ABS6SBB7_9SPHN|nr:LPS export ABC transporter periplasmic protein LptC [Pacificimonas pallii]MBV7255710.1 LPS export ABC transporter periplasmic protein LptC [Pacificimonas pallii]
MTEVAVPPISDAAEAQAKERRAWARPGSSWDRAAKLLRWVFPVMAVLILLTGLIWPLTQDREFSFILSKDQVEMAGDRMRLGAAIYRGEDAKGRPFMIRAASGIQQTSANPQVVLTGLSARMEMDGGAALVTAPRGVYDLEKERLLVSGPVKVQRPDGYRLVTSDVAVDIPSREVLGEGRVMGALPLGTFAADSLSADINERTLVLEGNTRMRINP